jgi:hypothetical protein
MHDKQLSVEPQMTQMNADSQRHPGNSVRDRLFMQYTKRFIYSGVPIRDRASIENPVHLRRKPDPNDPV